MAGSRSASPASYGLSDLMPQTMGNIRSALSPVDSATLREYEELESAPQPVDIHTKRGFTARQGTGRTKTDRHIPLDGRQGLTFSLQYIQASHQGLEPLEELLDDEDDDDMLATAIREAEALPVSGVSRKSNLQGRRRREGTGRALSGRKTEVNWTNNWSSLDPLEEEEEEPVAELANLNPGGTLQAGRERLEALMQQDEGGDPGFEMPTSREPGQSNLREIASRSHDVDIPMETSSIERAERAPSPKQAGMDEDRSDGESDVDQSSESLVPRNLEYSIPASPVQTLVNPTIATSRGAPVIEMLQEHNQGAAVEEHSEPTKKSQGNKEREGQRKRKALKSNRMSLAGAGTLWANGQRRSTRKKFKPLEYWRNEHLVYGRHHTTLPTVVTVVRVDEDPTWPNIRGRAKPVALTKTSVMTPAPKRIQK